MKTRPSVGSMMAVLLAVLALVVATLASSNPASAAIPPCQLTTSDSDGDGWGWENNQSCKVETDSGSGTGGTTGSDAECVDSDGDGYGWNGTTTCTPTGSGDGGGNTGGGNTGGGNSGGGNQPPPCQQQNSDPDGDGWGWENGQSCEVTSTPGGSGNTGSGNTNVSPPTNNDIIILFAGQSNSIGERTVAQSAVINGNRVGSGQDASDDRVKVFTADGNWETAELCSQVWLRWKGTKTHPQKNTNGGADSCGIHPGFHMAKRIAEQTNQSVYLIPTAEDGQPIEEWIGTTSCGRVPGGYDGSPGGMSAINQRLNAALGSSGARVDVVGWVQGEANSDQGAGAIAGHECKVQQLHTQLSWRSQIDGFGQNQTHFVASTVKPQAGNSGYENINIALENLGNSNSWFSVVNTRGYGTTDGTHYNSNDTRKLGLQMGQKYADSR